MSLSHLSAAARTFSELLYFHDEHFIRSAFQTLLNREPDPEGLRYYLAIVRSGVEKIEILSQLYMSVEGRSRQLKVNGLNETIEAYERLKVPLVGPLLRLTSVVSTSAVLTAEEKLYATEPLATQRFVDAEERFVHCAYWAILGRSPDSNGLESYLESVRSGIAKVEILAQLKRSDEGKSRWAQIARMNKAIRRHKQMQLPLVGGALRFVLQKSGNRVSLELLRSIENSLHILNEPDSVHQKRVRGSDANLHAHNASVRQPLAHSRDLTDKIGREVTPALECSNATLGREHELGESVESARAKGLSAPTTDHNPSLYPGAEQVYGSGLPRSQTLRWYYDLMHCPLFDRDWYLEQNPDVSSANIDPLWHYLVFGWKEGRRSGPEFDDEYYRARYTDVVNLEQPPLLHYWLYGRRENRQMNALLDLEWLQDDARELAAYRARISLNVPQAVNEMKKVPNTLLMSVIIPTYNRVKRLPGIVESWRKVHACTSHTYEIIFSDDGSSDGSVEYLESVEGLPLKVLRNAHGGASSARNAAIRAATGDRLLIIGDDIYPDKELLNMHVTLAQQMGKMVAILGVVDWHDELDVNHLMHHITEIGNEQFSYNRLKDCSFVDFRHFYTCNISLDRSLLLEEKVIFDERFDTAAFEDIELGYRLGLKGLRLYYTTQAKGTHYHPYTAAGFCRRQTSAGRMAVVFRNIHPGMEQVLGVDALSARATNDRQSSGQDAIWKNRFDLLVNRCEEYERIAALMPKDVASSIRICLSAVYTRLFSAMYEYGVLTQLGTHPNALAISMASRFEDTWANYWAALAHNPDPSLALDVDQSYNLGAALNSSNLGGLYFGTAQRATFDELAQIKMLVEGQQPMTAMHSLNAASMKKALPAIIVEPDDQNREEAIEFFRAAFGDSILVYEHLQGDLLVPQLDGGLKGESVSSSLAEATVFYWPTLMRPMALGSHLLNAYTALVENGLEIAVISHNLSYGATVSAGALRDQMLFSREVAPAILNNAIGSVPFRGKIVRLLPSGGAVHEQKLDVLIGAELNVDENGFFTNHSKGAVAVTRYEAPYLPPWLKTKPVVFVFPIFLAVGGVERNTIEIMRQLNKRFDFVVVTMERLRPEQGSLAAQAIEVAAKVIEMAEIIRHNDYLRLLTRLKAALQPDLIWVCNGSPWFCDNATAIRQIFYNVPIIDQEAYDVEQGWIARYGEPGIRSFDRFIAVNKKIEQRFLHDFAINPANIDLIYSAVDTSRIRSFKQSLPSPATIKTKFGLPDRGLIFTFVGRLTAQKRPLEFLRLAERRLGQAGEYFVLVGDGELSLEVQAFIEKNRLTNVKRIPYIENTLELHVVSDGIMFTSAYEGLPIAMIEALAMGVPTFATDVGDIATVLTEYGGGAVVPVNLTNELLDDALVSWIAQRDSYVRNLKKYESNILEHFSSENISKHYIQCWETAMKHYKRKAA
jgi:glycosyltransferase involved in cell wall biosynthesis